MTGYEEVSPVRWVKFGVDAAWIYYSRYGNPATGRDQPKASYHQENRLGRKRGGYRGGHLQPGPAGYLRDPVKSTPWD